MSETARPLKVFLCHASADKPTVRELAQRLFAEGWIDPWLDEKKLLPGQDWRLAIEEAVETSDIVMICLSNNSVSKEGYVQKELRYAREIAFEKPEETIFLIPLRLDECIVPRGLRFFQWADYFGKKKDETYHAILESLKLRYEQKMKLDRGSIQKEMQEPEVAAKNSQERVNTQVVEKAARTTPERSNGVIDTAVKDFEELLRSRATESEAGEKVRQLKEEYGVHLVDWGLGEQNYVSLDQLLTAAKKTWTNKGIENLYKTIVLMADLMGGKDIFIRNLGGVTIKKVELRSHAAEALIHQISLTLSDAITPWTIVHELAHAWDANYDWALSRQLEKYTGGYTSPLLALMKRLAGLSDSVSSRPEKKPGRFGRSPGSNRAGYFYGDKPSGSNWSFNRIEDFAESVAMYLGWGRGNELSQHAQNKILRYQLKNGEEDPFGVVDNWEDYKKFFYPEGGDYTRTKRWRFVDDLVSGRMDNISALLIREILGCH
jgi:hypothetical protein